MYAWLKSNAKYTRSLHSGQKTCSGTGDVSLYLEKLLQEGGISSTWCQRRFRFLLLIITFSTFLYLFREHDSRSFSQFFVGSPKAPLLDAQEVSFSIMMMHTTSLVSGLQKMYSNETKTIFYIDIYSWPSCCSVQAMGASYRRRHSLEKAWSRTCGGSCRCLLGQWVMHIFTIVLYCQPSQGVLGTVLSRGCSILRLARATMAENIFTSPISNQVWR